MLDSLIGLALTIGYLMMVLWAVNLIATAYQAAHDFFFFDSEEDYEQDDNDHSPY